jgi:hypothetical protein|tara:strand:- start:194 stop:721 length:528 start_codon:yes stop_codon:yes gene_type:complete
MRSKVLIFSQIFLIFALFTHCGVLSEAKDPLGKDTKHDAKYGEFEGKIIKQAKENRKGGLMGLMGNSMPEYKENIIWNVALEKISFMPLQSSDKAAGVITTEWFQIGEDLNNRIKLVIYVKSDTAEESSLDVKVFKEVFDGTKWNVSNQNDELASKIKKSIIDASRELYIANEMS